MDSIWWLMLMQLMPALMMITQAHSVSNFLLVTMLASLPLRTGSSRVVHHSKQREHRLASVSRTMLFPWRAFSACVLRFSAS